MNSQNSILLVDPTFDPNASLNCSLLIRLGIDSFSYAILDKEKNKICAVFDEQECENVIGKLSERLKNDTHLKLTFKEIKFSIYTENQISVPDELYDGDTAKLSVKAFNSSNLENLQTTAHPKFGFTSVFSFSPLTAKIIDEALSNSRKFHSNAALLKLAETIGDTTLFLDFTAGAVYVLYSYPTQVIFQQGYEIENAEEFNYYLLLMINHLAFDCSNTNVCVSGIIDESDEKYSCLKEYFNKVQFLAYIQDHLDQHLLDDMPSHYYTTLLALDQCV